MLCYDRSKCGVISGPQLARLTQRHRGVISPAISVSAVRGMRQGMGFPVAAVAGAAEAGMGAIEGAKSIIDKIGGFFGGLFGKSPDKAQFDNVRQNTWNQFATIVDAVDNLERTGQLTREQLQAYMRSLQTLIENFDSYYNRVRAAVTPAYGDSRFRDFMDPMQAKYDEWQAELIAMPAGGFFGGITGSLSNMGGGEMLMLGAFALAIFSGSRRSRA